MNLPLVAICSEVEMNFLDAFVDIENLFNRENYYDYIIH